ncbi:hypothetical protein LBMAG42_46910 [Deltaproteobacteria bacterium]|nr:hypothetical protein LBMAG42_46910 [Deltaproteobacteria bacterium]
MNPGAAFRYMRGIARGVRRGDTFPPASRVPSQSAPLGSRVLDTTPGGFNQLVAWETVEHTIGISGLAEPLRVLQLSDVHLRKADAALESLCARITAIEADLVVLTGDVVTRGWSREAADRFLSAIPKTKFGCFAIIGNWEYWAQAPPATWRFVLGRHNIPLLLDESVDLGPIQLVGTDDALAGMPDLARAFASVDYARPTLCLTHSPALFDSIARPGVPLVLAGHTHGGQVVIPRLGSFFLPRGSGAYPWGWYENGNSHLFVSRGLGWSVAPLRVACKPEIALLRLEPG